MAVGADRAFDRLQFTSVQPLFTAELALGELARMQPGETILIHGAAGGMGMGAVQVAVRMGARVIATASTPERREAVRALGAAEVLNSRSISFVDEVMRLTDGRGVDVIYTSAPGEILQQNFRVAAEFGRIVDIGKADIYGSATIDLRPFDRNLSFFAVDIDRMVAHDPERVRRAIGRIVDALRRREYTPIPNAVFGLDRLAEAFETVARSTQIGRVLLDLRDEQPPVRHIPSTVEIDPGASYLITGGFGAFGLATARELAAKGAGTTVLAQIGACAASVHPGRPATPSQPCARAVRRPCSASPQVDVAARRLRRRRRCSPAWPNRPATVRGVFHAAGVLDGPRHSPSSTSASV